MRANAQKGIGRPALIAIVVVLVAVAGAGTYWFYGTQGVTPTSSTTSSTSSTSVTERFAGESALYAAAKTEGSLVIYTAQSSEQFQPQVAAFEAAYPGINVEYISMTDGDQLARVQVEYAAHKQSVDIIHGTSPVNLQALGMTLNYTSVQNEQLFSKGDGLVPVDIFPTAVIYNTDKINASDIPKTWMDLASPKYKNMFALQDPITLHSSTDVLNAIYNTWNNNTKFTEFITGLKNNAVGVYQSGSQMGEMLVAGEFPMCVPCGIADYLTDKAAGAHIALDTYLAPEAAPDFMGMYIYSAHVNAAKLFMEWELTPTAQLIISSAGYTPNKIGVETSSSISSVFGAGTVVMTPDPVYLRDPVPWVDSVLVPVFGSSY